MSIANDDLYAQSWNTNFGSNPFDDSPTEYSQNTVDTEYTQFDYLMITALPRRIFKKQWKSPEEQITAPDENHE